MNVGTSGIGLAPRAGSRGRARLALLLVAGMLLTLLPVGVQAQAEEAASQVTGLTAEQQEGFVTLRWDPVDGAVQYEIERTPVDESNEPTGASSIEGIWRPSRQIPEVEQPTFAESGFVPGERYRWRVRAVNSTLPNLLTVDAPSSAAGQYGMTQATFGPTFASANVSGPIVLVNDGSANPTQGCQPLIDFPAGAIALVDRGCTFTTAAANAQAAGAIALIIANNVASAPTNPTGTAPGVTIPVGMISQADGAALKAGLPATGSVGSSAGPFSEPVFGTTIPQWGDPSDPNEGMRTQWEQTLGAQYTSDVNEYAYTDAIAQASDRMRYVEIARTRQGRPVNLLIFGYPSPPETAEEIAEGAAAMINCNVHGNEPSSREACFIMARQLAFSDDPRIIDILSNMTVLMVPSINADGRANNTRGNTTGQDLNRDHSLLRQPETFGFAQALRDYDAEAAFDGHEFGNQNAGDLPVLMPRHLNVPQEIFDRSKSMIEDFFYVRGSEEGWWYCPYGCQGGGNVGLSQETILRNTLGLKNTVASLLEARSSGGPTRPDESTQENRRRKTYSAMFTYHEFLDWVRANQDELVQGKKDAAEWQKSNTGPVVARGSREVPAFPAPHPGEAPPPTDAPVGLMEEPPCGYLLSEEQYKTVLADSAPGFPTTVEDRLAAHGIRVDARASDYLVPMAQPFRGLIVPLLDEGAPEPMTVGERLFDEAVCHSSFGTATDLLDELVAAGGITEGLEGKVRHALAQAQSWLELGKPNYLAMTHIDRAVHLLLWQADVIEDKDKPNQGDPEGLRALAAALLALKATYVPGS